MAIRFGVNLINGNAYFAELGTHHIFVAVSRVTVSCCFIDASSVTACFYNIFPRCFAARVILFQTHHKTNFRVINFKLLQLDSTPISLHSLLPPFLAVKITPLHLAVILHPCWLPTSPLPTQLSSSDPPAVFQIHPSPPSSHHPPLLAVKLTPPRPSVILHSCWRLNSPRRFFSFVSMMRIMTWLPSSVTLYSQNYK